MKKIFKKELWGYVGRFSLIYVITYSVIAILFLIFQDMLPASDRVALDFFKPYRYPNLTLLIKQGIRGGVLGLILYPFYDNFVSNNQGWLIIFGALWGLGIFCSVEPMPGSLEGLLYTQTTIAEHFAVLTAAAVQTLFFSWVFLYWERWSSSDNINLERGVDYV